MVVVHYFAAAKDAVGVASEDIVDVGVTVARLRVLLGERHPGLVRVLAQSRIAINQRFAKDDDVVGDGAEVAVIPPVAGG